MSERIIASRKGLRTNLHTRPLGKAKEKCGCGVAGFSSNVPVRGRHIFEPSIQMHNRGNGKGGGIAPACFIPEQLGVDVRTLRNSYILQIALLDPTADSEVENTCIIPYLRINHKTRLKPAADYIDLGLTVAWIGFKGGFRCPCHFQSSVLDRYPKNGPPV